MLLRDDQSNELIGALGIVLFDHPETTLQPLINKFANLQRDLDDARRELASQRRNKYTLASFVGGSPAAVEVKRRRAARRCRPARCCCWARRARARNSGSRHPRGVGARRGPLVSVNIAAVPDTLLEAEFFGVAPGAYTGADRKGRDGKFKLADGGPCSSTRSATCRSSLQPKLLRALQEGEIEPLGSNKVVAFDARVIAATSRDLPRWCARAVPRRPVVPAERAADPRAGAARAGPDIPALVEVLVEDMGLRSGSPPPELGADAIALLSAHAGAATSASCATCWSRRRCADSRRINGAHLEEVLRESGIAQIARPSAPPGGEAGRRPGRYARWPSRWRSGAPGHRSSAPVHRRQQAGGGQGARDLRGRALRAPERLPGNPDNCLN